MNAFPALIVSDLDGTLLPRSGVINAADIKALQRLGELGIKRAIATGRSLFSYKRAGLPPLPLDYLVHATGAGILDVVTGENQSIINLDKASSSVLAATLQDLEISFMLQGPVPDNHHFVYWSKNGMHPDFKRRLDLYQGFYKALDIYRPDFDSCSQAIIICDPEEGQELLLDLRQKLQGYKIVRTTSPIDHYSMWIEIFPADVSKGHALSRLCESLGIGSEDVWVVGNDYNDLDMLEFAGRAFVVNDAPNDLRLRFEVADAKSPIAYLTGLMGI